MKRVTLRCEEFDEDTGELIAVVSEVTVGPDYADSLPHMLKVFVSFLTAMTFRVDALAAFCGRCTHTSADVD
jgi:hypothetical protein